MADPFNPGTPQWLRDANLSVRICNVLTANGLIHEADLRDLLDQTGLRTLRRFHGVGIKSLHELLEWAQMPPPASDDIPRPDRTAQLAQADRIRREFFSDMRLAKPLPSPRAFEVLARTGTCSVQVVLDALTAAGLVIVENK